MHEFLHMRTAPFIANPAGDTDKTIHIKVFIQFRFAAGKAMYDNIIQVVTVFLEYRDKIIMRVTLVQKKRQSGLDCNLNLKFE